MVSIIYHPKSGFYVFDSHARNSFGMPDINGKAVLLNLRSIVSLENYFQMLATAVNASFFEVVSVTFHNLNSSESQEFTLNINDKKRKLSHKLYIESEQQQQLKKPCQFVANKLKNKSECQVEKQLPKMQCKAKIYENERESERKEQLLIMRLNEAKKRANETEFERENRLKKRRQNAAKKLANEFEPERMERLARKRQDKATRIRNETEMKRTERLRKRRMQEMNKRQHLKYDKKKYLAEFNVSNGSIYEQTWAKMNMNRFHESTKFLMKQCKVCFETWPVKLVSLSENFTCARCSRDKKLPKRFSKENGMIPSAVPRELQGLTQTEEMLIARALPMMRVYVKPGGQRGYSGRCINLPQRVEELASKLPRYPKDLAIIVVQMKGKNNSTKDMKVR